MSPDPCSDFSSSSFDTFDHSPPPISPNSFAASQGPVPQPPPYIPSSFPPSQVQASATAAATNSPPQSVPEISSELRTPRPRSPKGPKAFYPDLPGSPPFTQSPKTVKQETSLQDPAPSPAPFFPLQKAAGAEGIVQFMSHSLSPIYLRLKSILAPSPQIGIII